MPHTDTTEKGLESLIVAALTGQSAAAPPGTAKEPSTPYGAEPWLPGDPADYDRDHAVDIAKLLDFLKATQPKAVEQLELDQDGPARAKFLARLQGEITKRGVIDVLRHGVKHYPATVDLFYGAPTPGNPRA